MSNSEAKPTVGIIGSGISGICAFVQLKTQLGISATVFELGNTVGGVWANNTYPGCRCDVPSYLYSYSFELNPSWSETFSKQKEILSYLKHVCHKHGMMDHIMFETKVVETVWHDDLKKWRVVYQKQGPAGSLPITETLYFDILFSSMGTLRIPKIPEVFTNFEGPVVHTGAWDSSIDFTNKRVAVVGGGSSGIQVIPELARQASQLTVFQRSVPWVVDIEIKKTSAFLRALYYLFPFLIYIHRFFIFLNLEKNYLFHGYPDSFLGSFFSKMVISNIGDKLVKIGREDWVEDLTPDYTLGCKRGVSSPFYYDALSKYNVQVKRSPIQTVEDNRIITENGNVTEVDILVLATGFKTTSGVFGDTDIIGKGNQSLPQLWEDNDAALHKSTSIHGYPNFFLLLGPYCTPGHNSAIVVVENQVKYAIRSIRDIWMKHGIPIEPKKSAQDGYMRFIYNSLKSTAWVGSCNSWYKNKRGTVTGVWPNTVTRFVREISKFSTKEFIGF